MKRTAFFQWALMLMAVGLLSACGQFPETATSSNEKKPVIPAWVSALPQQADVYQARGVATVPKGTADQSRAKARALQQAVQRMTDALTADMLVAMNADRMTALQEQGRFEQAVRQAVRNTLPKWPLPAADVKDTFYDADTGQLYVWAQWPYEKLHQHFEKILLSYDQYLRNYIHVSSAGSHLTQILSILPALPTLEARQQLLTMMQTLKPETTSTPNHALAELLNRQLSNQFDALIISFNAQTDESETWEPALKSLMETQGFNTTARRPDILMKYYFEPTYLAENGHVNVRLTTDAELLGEKGDTFANVSREYNGLGADRASANEAALQEFSQEVTAKMVESSVNYLTQANKTMPPMVMETTK